VKPYVLCETDTEKGVISGFLVSEVEKRKHEQKAVGPREKRETGGRVKVIRFPKEKRQNKWTDVPFGKKKRETKLTEKEIAVFSFSSKKRPLKTRSGGAEEKHYAAGSNKSQMQKISAKLGHLVKGG